MKHALIASVVVAALFAAPALAETEPAPNGPLPMHDLFHYPPAEDEVSGAFDKASGLGTWTACDERAKTPAVTIQFSYSGKAPLTFAADFVPDAAHRITPKPKIVHTLTPQEPTWTYTAPVESCDDRYVLFVGYPK